MTEYHPIVDRIMPHLLFRESSAEREAWSEVIARDDLRDFRRKSRYDEAMQLWIINGKQVQSVPETRGSSGDLRTFLVAKHY
jgi:hypothetical protein